MNDVEASLRIVRTLDAPRDRVWHAWTDPAELSKWWWPARFQTTFRVDLRSGGTYHFQSADLPDLGVLAISGEFLEVDPPERLVYTWRWGDDSRPESRVVIEFIDRGSQTELHLTHEGLADRENRENHVAGWNDCLDRLQDFSASGLPAATS